MTSPHVTPANDPAALGRACSTLLDAAAAIVAQMLPALDPRAREGIESVLGAGGTLNVEASTDAVGAPRVMLTVVTSEGVRYELASAHVPDRPAGT